MNKDLTVGKPSQVLWQFCLPMFGSIIFQQLYNIADSLVAGKFIGENALAAVGNSYEITLIFIAFAFGCNIGCSVIVSRYFGAKDYDEMKTSVYTSLIGSAVLCAVLMLIGLVGCHSLLELINTPEEILADSSLYLDIYVLGLPFMFFYNIATGIFSALGDSKTPFYFLAVSSLSNIGVDILFVAGFKMGVAGAAIATIVSQILSAVLATAKLMRSTEAYRITVKGICIDRYLLGRMLRIGIPSGLQSSMYAISNMIIQVAVNLLGTATVAAWSLTGKLDGFYWACSNAAGIAVMNFTAQNYGAGRMDRVHGCEKLSLKLFMGITLLFSAVLLGFGRFLLPLFNDDAEVLAQAWQMMLYMVPLYFTWTYIEIISGILRGMGDAIVPVIIIGLGVCLLRVVWIATVYKAHHTMLNVCLAYPISWIVTDVAFFFYYRRVKWLYHIK